MVAGLLTAASVRAQWVVTILPPALAEGQSYIAGVSSTQQVGYIYSGLTKATVWSGAAGSWVDLNPLGSFASFASAVDDFVQVGWVGTDPSVHASIWTGTAGSLRDLTPVGHFRSQAFGVSGNQQVGLVGFATDHAALWTGTAASWVDLNPPIATASVANATDGFTQVGAATINGVRTACLWHGTPASFVALAPGTGATASVARGISGSTVAGYTIGTGG